MRISDWSSDVCSSDLQTLTARALLDNPDGRWAPGLYVTAEFTLSESQVPLAIRNAAVQSLDGQSVVFVRRDAGLMPQPIRLGKSASDFSEVLAGIKAGESYAPPNRSEERRFGKKCGTT